MTQIPQRYIQLPARGHYSPNAVIFIELLNRLLPFPVRCSSAVTTSGCVSSAVPVQFSVETFLQPFSFFLFCMNEYLVGVFDISLGSSQRFAIPKGYWHCKKADTPYHLA